MKVFSSEPDFSKMPVGNDLLRDLTSGPAASPTPVDNPGVPPAFAQAFENLTSDGLRKMLEGETTQSNVSVREAMKNTAVKRCVSLISFAIGYLPLILKNAETKENAKNHSLFNVLRREPNNWQTAFNFKQYMQRNALVHGDAFALIVRSMGRIIRLVPLDPRAVEVIQNGDWSLTYRYTPVFKDGRQKPNMRPVDYPASQILHIYADTEDGITGVSTVKDAARAIALAKSLENSQLKLFKTGMLVGGAITHPNRLSKEAYENLADSMEKRYSGEENSGKFMLLEEGMTAQQFRNTAKDSQQIESRELQIEEIGRAFGVPRPFLGVDDTSWGSGVDVLGQLFVRYGLKPWFTAWEQAVERSCLMRDEKDTLSAMFDARPLLLGSIQEMGEFYSKALGAGGHQPWMDYEEVRDEFNMPKREVAPNPMTKTADEGGAPNEPETTS